MDAMSSAMTANFTAQTAMAAQNTSGGLQKKARTEAEFAETANKFESMFMAQMLQPMFSGVAVDDTFGGGHGEEMMRGLLTQEYGKAMAANDTSGLSDAIKDQMLKMQEHASKGKVAA